MSRLDQLAQLAAKAEPPALDDTGARRLVDAALLDAGIAGGDVVRAARSRLAPAAYRSRTVRWFAGGAALAIAAAIAVIVLRPTPGPQPVTRIALPTGDSLTGTAGARFSITELTPASRRLRLDAGTMVFDVAHVVVGQHFEVAAGDVTVVATGTVFSVAADPVRVHVYEGSVEVHRADRVDRVAAGASYGPGRDPRELVEAGDAAARARGPRIAAVAPPPTVVTHVITIPIPVPIRVLVPVATSKSESIVQQPPPEAVTTPEPAPVEPVDANLVAARADVTAGRYTAALTKVAAAPHPLTGPWLLVDADALRALGKTHDAADALAAAAAVLDGTAQLEAAYSAAYLRFHDLHDAAGALTVLTAADVDIPGSLFEERGLALHVQILVADGKRAEARPLAQRYLDRFPTGELRATMLGVIRQDASK